MQKVSRPASPAEGSVYELSLVEVTGLHARENVRWIIAKARSAAEEVVLR
jgi:hypothetical protein